MKEKSSLFARITAIFKAALPPKALQRRHDILEKASDFIALFVAHFERVSKCVAKLHARLILAARVWIALAAHRYEVHLRDIDECGDCFWGVKFFEFFFKVKRHCFSLNFDEKF